MRQKNPQTRSTISVIFSCQPPLFCDLSSFQICNPVIRKHDPFWRKYTKQNSCIFNWLAKPNFPLFVYPGVPCRCVCLPYTWRIINDVIVHVNRACGWRIKTSNHRPCCGRWMDTHSLYHRGKGVNCMISFHIPHADSLWRFWSTNDTCLGVAVRPEIYRKIWACLLT